MNIQRKPGQPGGGRGRPTTIGVAVGVAVRVEVGLGVCELVGVGDAVAVGVDVRLGVGVGVEAAPDYPQSQCPEPSGGSVTILPVMLSMHLQVTTTAVTVETASP